MKKGALYSAAVYLRVSKEDEDIQSSHKSVSNSIASQRELTCSFVREQKDMELFEVYIDDGYSGANFDRPDFKRMMADIRAGHVNCVIVKDLSRFGRDYIEAGRFIQKTFPAFSVRFIAITDNYDSLTADRNTTSLVIPVKNFVNDSYCRDISIKVKSHQKIKREQGKFIGAFAVYGYRKDAEDKNRLVPDDYASGIVKNIFAWKLDGMSSLAISDHLNELGVLSPLEYKKLQGENYKTGFPTGIAARWSATAVKRILTNEIYTGTMVQGKREKINYKVKKVAAKPEAEWMKVQGTHEAIVSTEDFENVRRLLQVDTRAEKGKDRAHIFSGLLFCGDCKGTMVRRMNRYKRTEKVYYICSAKNRSEGCTRHSILEADLRDIVLKLLQIQTAVFTEITSQTPVILEEGAGMEELAKVDKEIERLQREGENYAELRAGLYEDLKRHIITQADFKSFGEIYEKQYEAVKRALVKQEEMRTRLFYSRTGDNHRQDERKKAMELTEWNRNLLLAFIDRIEVYEHKRIYIKLSCREEFQRWGGGLNGEDIQKERKA